MIAIGLANGNIPRDPSEISPQLAKEWRASGITVLATSFAMAAADQPITRLHEIRSILDDQGIRIVQFAGINANLSHVDADVRASGLERIRRVTDAANALGVEYLISGSGSSHPDWQSEFYASHKDNHTPAAEHRLAEALAVAGDIAASAGLKYAVECHQLTTMRNAETIRRVLDAADRPNVFANIDVVNLLDSAWAVNTNAERIPEILNTLGPRAAPTVHVKDVRVEPGLVCHINEVTPGEGVLDFKALFDSISKLPSDPSLIVEHLSGQAWAHGVHYVISRAKEHGLALTQ